MTTYWWNEMHLIVWLVFVSESIESTERAREGEKVLGIVVGPSDFSNQKID